MQQIGHRATQHQLSGQGTTTIERFAAETACLCALGVQCVCSHSVSNNSPRNMSSNGALFFPYVPLTARPFALSACNVPSRDLAAIPCQMPWIFDSAFFSPLMSFAYSGQPICHRIGPETGANGRVCLPNRVIGSAKTALMTQFSSCFLHF